MRVARLSQPISSRSGRSSHTGDIVTKRILHVWALTAGRQQFCPRPAVCIRVTIGQPRQSLTARCGRFVWRLAGGRCKGISGREFFRLRTYQHGFARYFAGFVRDRSTIVRKASFWRSKTRLRPGADAASIDSRNLASRRSRPRQRGGRSRTCPARRCKTQPSLGLCHQTRGRRRYNARTSTSTARLMT